MNTETEKISVPTFLRIFRKFSNAEKQRIAEEIDRETFDARWSSLDDDLPDVDMSDAEIMDEIRTVRYANDKAR